MGSPVGWLCFGIVVVCAISVKSGISSGNYQIIQGHGFGYPGPVLQRMVPTIDYSRSAVPQIVARRVEPQSDDDYDNSNPCPPEVNPDEDPDDDYNNRDEEFNEFQGEGEEGDSDENVSGENESDYYYRQANENNKFHPNATAQTVPRKTSSNLRTSLQKNSSKEPHRKSNYKSNSAKKRKPSQITEKTNSHENNANHKQTYQLDKLIANSHTKFVAAPIADLILRLSISLAKPIAIEHGNATATHFNVPVPIRLSNTGTEENISSDVLNASSPVSKLETELHKTNSIVTSPGPFKIITVPIKAEIPENQEIDDNDNIDQALS